MDSGHYKKFKENISERNVHKEKAEEKKRKASKLPILGALDKWLAARHEKKAEKHEEMAFGEAQEHAKELKKKHKI